MLCGKFYCLPPDCMFGLISKIIINDNDGIPYTGLRFRFSKSLHYNSGLENEVYKRVFAVNGGFY